MKQIAALTLALVLALSLASCGGKDPKPSGSSGSDTLPASTQQTDPGDTKQEPPDTPDASSGDEEEPSGEADNDAAIPELVAGDWPDNAFTELVPKPSAGTAIASDTGDTYCVIEMDWSIEEAMAYAEQLQNAGFNINVAAQDMSQAGMYTFVADNADGAKAKILYLGPEEGNRVIRIEK